MQAPTKSKSMPLSLIMTGMLHFCDSLLLPVLEPYAAFAPVTFTVQENHVPEYNPSSVISTRYVNEGSAGSLEPESDIQINSSLLRQEFTTVLV